MSDFRLFSPESQGVASKILIEFDEKDGLSLSHMLTLAECRAAKKKG